MPVPKPDNGPWGQVTYHLAMNFLGAPAFEVTGIHLPGRHLAAQPPGNLVDRKRVVAIGWTYEPGPDTGSVVDGPLGSHQVPHQATLAGQERREVGMAVIGDRMPRVPNAPREMGESLDVHSQQKKGRRDAMLPEKENFLSVNRGDRARAALMAD